MAKLVLTDAFLSVGGTDLSDHVQSLTLTYSADEVEQTAMGDDTHLFLGGLKNVTMDVEFQQDFAASEVDATMFSAVGTGVAIVFRPTSAAVGATNPEYTFTGLLSSYSLVGNSVGDLAMAPVTFAAQSALARATA